MNFKYKKVALGGTFDLLHIGHKALISKAFELSHNVVIGVTTDKFIQKQTFQDQNLRLKNLKSYLKNKKFKAIWLDDIFGTTLSDSEIEAIVVSPETKKSALLINSERVKKGLKRLEVIVVPFVKDESNKIISSSRIRNGEINSEGFNYKKFLLNLAGQKLSDQIRDRLKAPLGKIVHISSSRDEKVLTDFRERGDLITVGDITTNKFLNAGITPKLAIIDNLVNRHPFPNNLKPDIKVTNPPGQISRVLITAVERSLQQTILHTTCPSGRRAYYIIQVVGEEDLAAIPAILLASLGTKVFYGQPNEGLVLVNVNLEIKNKLISLIDIDK